MFESDDEIEELKGYSLDPPPSDNGSGYFGDK